MKSIHYKQYLFVLLLMSSLCFYGCANINPIDPQSPSTIPTPKSEQVGDSIVTYDYADTGDVQLSANNLTLKVGQRLILEPALGLSKNTRFTSSGEYYFSDIMEQDIDQPNEKRVVFIGKKPGKGKLQIIPNSTEIDRAVDLWVTVIP